MISFPRLARIFEIIQVTPLIKQFTLECALGGRLPAWSGGSHVTVFATDGGRSWRNSYSLIGMPGETAFYQIAVRKEDTARSKGGSRFLHDEVDVGDTLEISVPRNDFPLARHAKKSLLIAGGIGITPFLAQMVTLKQSGMPYELHYAFRDRLSGAFHEAICAVHGPNVKLHVGSEGGRLTPKTILENQPLGTHVSVCGPASLIADVRAAAREQGWPDTHVHFEAFVAPPLTHAKPFRVSVPDLGIDTLAGSRMTLLEALERAGVRLASSCRVGRCGTCVVRVLEGEPDHRDQCLTDDEKRDGRLIACVSRCRGDAMRISLPSVLPV